MPLSSGCSHRRVTTADTDAENRRSNKAVAVLAYDNAE